MYANLQMAGLAVLGAMPAYSLRRWQLCTELAFYTELPCWLSYLLCMYVASLVQALVASDPDVIIIGPCGLDLATARVEAMQLVKQPWW
jgi:hypothetical protein